MDTASGGTLAGNDPNQPGDASCIALHQSWSSFALDYAARAAKTWSRMIGTIRTRALALTLATVTSFSALFAAETTADLARGFARPPESARPWVYWFWLNGNITREGITADLEAMKRVGIGGVLIMEVDQGAPVGPVPFMSAAVARAVQARGRRGAAARAGSEHEQRRRLERQRRAVDQAGAVHAEGGLDRDRASTGPAALRRAAAAAAEPWPASTATSRCWRFPRAGDVPHRRHSKQRPPFSVAATGNPPAAARCRAEMVIERGSVVDLTAQHGRQRPLAWDVPPGKWTVLRFGHTSTGARKRAGAGQRPRAGVRQAEQGGHRGQLRRA